jgi:glutathione S-transferase
MRLYDYAASGNCYKVRLLLGLLEQPYERVPVDIFAGETLTDEFLALNPTRETPVLQLDDGRVVTQSNAILWFLARGTRFLPETPFGEAEVVSWLSFEQERVMAGIGAPRFWRLTGREESRRDAFRDRVALGRGALAAMDGALSERDFLAGELSIADVSVFAYAHVAPDVGIDLADYPAVSAWIERLRGQPGFVDDYVAYPENARPGVSRSIYD